MRLFRRQSKPALARRSWAQFQLHTIPVRNAAATARPADAPVASLVTVPLRHGALVRLLARPLALRTQRTFALDAIGAELLGQIDGSATVGQLIDAFAASHRLTFFEARALVCAYLVQLLERGIVAIGVPKTPT